MSIYKIFIFTCFCLLICSCKPFAFKNSGKNGKNTFTDLRDGKTYKTIQIGEQIWMAENLNYATSSGSWCYDDDIVNCEKYGRLYIWETAINSCPHGWRLPSKSDFDSLLMYVYDTNDFYYQALETGGKSGFDAIFGGFRSNEQSFKSFDGYGPWWSSLEYDEINEAWCLIMYTKLDEAIIRVSNKGDGFSVRCVKE